MKRTDNTHDTWVDDVASKEIVFDGGIHIAEEPEAERKRHWLRNRVTFFVCAGLVLAVVGWLVAGVFLSQVSIGTTNVAARQSDDQLRRTIDHQVSNYELTIDYPSGPDKSFALSEVGLKVDATATIHELRKNQHDLSRRMLWWRPTKVFLALKSNDAERNSFIAKHATVTIQPATSATLSIKDGEVVITDSTPGQHYGLEGPVATLHDTVASMRTEPLRLQTLSTRPVITSRQLAPYQAQLKEMLNQSVALTIAGKVFRPTVADISKWIEISLNKDGKKVDVAVNSGLVLDYVNSISAPFVKPAKNQVEFAREDGTKAVLSKGTEGTDVVGKKDLATKVAKDLLDNKAVNETLQIDRANFQTISAGTYDKWIEVDITKKRMYLYEQSTLVRTYLVSAGAPATPTVTGQYAIYSKVEQQDMRGSNVDGSSYFQPDVAWVNYFYRDYAIHGNYWRPLSWFGNVNSSHGCVGLPNIEAQWVYNWAPKGTPVIIHD
jgi:lipoprotein-anchoring transpeptidase ErfK/SrfK